MRIHSGMGLRWGKEYEDEEDAHDSRRDRSGVRICRLLHLHEDVCLHEVHAWPGLCLRLWTDGLHLRQGVRLRFGDLLLQEVMLSTILIGLGDCCTSMNWVCNCFPCTCVKCCCLYGASALTLGLAVLGVVRVVVGKDGVEVVGGDEKTRAEVAALLAKANYSVNVVAAETWKFGDATVDVSRQTVVSAEGVVSRLTGKEIKILRLFSADPKAVVSREAILSTVWGLKYWGTTRTVDQHIAQLRKKLGVDILSVRGVGYRLA